MRSAYLSLTLDSDQEADRVFALLSDGGQIFMPMRQGGPEQRRPTGDWPLHEAPWPIRVGGLGAVAAARAFRFVTSNSGRWRAGVPARRPLMSYLVPSFRVQLVEMAPARHLSVATTPLRSRPCL